MDRMTPNAAARPRTLSDRSDGQDELRPAHADLSRMEPARADPSQRRLSILAKAVQQEVIPRLLAQREPQAAPALGAVQVAALAKLSLQAQTHETVDFVMALLERGIAAEQLYLDLLSPAARLLGQFWVDDVCNFADVTIGLGQLQHALRALGPAFLGRQALAPADGPRAFLLPLPGEQHGFGLTMLADFFRRGGWNTWSGQVADTAELRGMVRAEWVDLVGFSLACDEMLEAAAREIAAVRLASRNPRLIVMVGGPPFLADPALAASIGADGTARDGRSAVAAAEALLPRQPKRR